MGAAVSALRLRKLALGAVVCDVVDEVEQVGVGGLVLGADEVPPPVATAYDDESMPESVVVVVAVSVLAFFFSPITNSW